MTTSGAFHTAEFGCHGGLVAVAVVTCNVLFAVTDRAVSHPLRGPRTRRRRTCSRFQSRRLSERTGEATPAALLEGCHQRRSPARPLEGIFPMLDPTAAARRLCRTRPNARPTRPRRRTVRATPSWPPRLPTPQARRWCPKAEDRRQPTGAADAQGTEAAQPRPVTGEGGSSRLGPAVRAPARPEGAAWVPRPARAHRAVVPHDAVAAAGAAHTLRGAASVRTPRTLKRVPRASMTPRRTRARGGSRTRRSSAPSQRGREAWCRDRATACLNGGGRRRIHPVGVFPGSGSLGRRSGSTAGSRPAWPAVGRYLHVRARGAWSDPHRGSRGPGAH